MTIPTSVRMERILFAQSDCSASLKASPIGMICFHDTQAVDSGFRARYVDGPSNDRPELASRAAESFFRAHRDFQRFHLLDETCENRYRHHLRDLFAGL